MFEGSKLLREIARLSDDIDGVLDSRAALVDVTPASAGWVERICRAARVENRAAAAQLVAIGELFVSRLSGCADARSWAADAETAVAAEVAAALRISQGFAASRLRYARALRERLPKVGAVFVAGLIDFGAFRTIVYRTELITDPQVLARVDEKLALNVARWPSMSQARLSGKVDRVVAGADADAVRRRKQSLTDREIWISPDLDGICRIEGSLFTPDAQALDARLTALAATVCADDPRTRDQRRCDAMGALAAGADRLGCKCARRDCPAGTRRPACPAVVHIIAADATVAGADAGPGSTWSADGLVTAELLAELAGTATLIPLTHPGDTAPEPGRQPSKALADFIRCRDLTCRWPGCDVPATHCDLDHTIAWADGGTTHPANIKCYCRTHHLIKTFWGWTEQQLADGTLILTSPAGQTHVTTPGSALLFPSLCRAVGGMPAPDAEPPPTDYCGNRSAMMPTRRRTRDQDRATRIAAERRHNHQARTQPQPVGCPSPGLPDDRPPEDDPPPF